MKANLVIGALITTNVALAGIVAYQALELRKAQDGLYADHVQQLRMDVPHQLLRVRLGRSATAGGARVDKPEQSGTLALTPRAAIQLHVQLGEMIRLVQQAAAESLTTQSAEPQSPDRPL